LVGRNRYKTVHQTMVSVMNRNRLAHPDSKVVKEEEDTVKAVVEHVQVAMSKPAPEATLQEVSALHKVDVALLTEAMQKPEVETSSPVKAAVEAVLHSVKEDAVQEAVTKHNVTEQVVVKAVRSREACDHGIKQEDTTRDAYNANHGTSEYEQQPVRGKLVTSKGNSYVLYGKLDGFDMKEQCVVEFKNRMRRLFHSVPDYEYPQLYAYMALTATTLAKQVEQYGDTTAVHDVSFNEDEWSCIRAELDAAVDEMMRIHQANRHNGKQRGLREFFPTV
jgi:hypothetical protein